MPFGQCQFEQHFSKGVLSKGIYKCRIALVALQLINGVTPKSCVMACLQLAEMTVLGHSGAFGKSDGTDVRLPENFCWGVGGWVGGWIIVFLTSQTSQYYKVCEGTACAQLAEYNKVRLQRKCRDVRVGGFCGLGHALPLFQSLAMHDKYTNTQIQTQMQKSVNTQMQKLSLVGWVTLILSLQSLAIHNNPSLHCKTRPRAIVTMGKCAQRAE